MGDKTNKKERKKRKVVKLKFFGGKEGNPILIIRYDHGE